MEKTLEGILERIYRDGLDGEKSPEEYDYTKSTQAIRALLKKKMPEEKKFGKDYDRGSNCDLNYVNGYNIYYDEMQKVIESL